MHAWQPITINNEPNRTVSTPPLLRTHREKHVKTKRLSSPCAWDIYTNGLSRNSDIICAGAGGDISFEVELDQAAEATVILLNPSPTGRETVEKTPPAQLALIKYHCCPK